MPCNVRILSFTPNQANNITHLNPVPHKKLPCPRPSSGHAIHPSYSTIHPSNPLPPPLHFSPSPPFLPLSPIVRHYCAWSNKSWDLGTYCERRRNWQWAGGLTGMFGGGGGGLKDDFGWGGAGVNGRREGGKWRREVVWGVFIKVEVEL